MEPSFNIQEMVTFVACVVALVFAWAAVLNLSGPAFVRAEFKQLGYPTPLRIAFGLAELLAAILLVTTGLQFYGAALAAILLIGIWVSVARTGIWMRLEYPTVLFILSVGLMTHFW